ncbi:MAG: hypothetical protein ONB46_02245 [candidate division KSB1 bacterium]|nr:hypothetical protein [candidate division KSB1 bacterium]MDZ7364488.1 hypothetical protein [candidate division KSB1 bacterium]MDZ7402860.1 hypothetical protein [candidate division KSB1 bacterium]
MKTRSHVFAIHFSVIAFEFFCQQLVCLSEKLAALGRMPALQNLRGRACPAAGQG